MFTIIGLCRTKYLGDRYLDYQMADILNIGGESIFDDRIVKLEFHTYNPYVNTTFRHSEISILIQ